MALSIVDHNVPYDSYDLYDVNFYNDQILTLVTKSQSYVSGWISEIESIHRHRLNNLIVGLDVEWRPCNRIFNNPVATLQLCVGHRCLIFQILHSDHVPQSLSDFLANSAYTFVGVGIKDDKERILRDYGLQVLKMVDLRGLAADWYGLGYLNNAGLKGLANLVLGKEIEKPLNVTLSRWDNHWLNPYQVQYACIDAFVSFEIGRSLNAAGD